MLEDTTLARRLKLAYLVLCLVYMAWAVWLMTVPEHKRTELRLRLLRWSAQEMSRLARRTGAASMGHELATGDQQYGIPYRLSLGREALQRAYDRVRGAL